MSRLTFAQVDIEKAVPSSTVSSTSGGGSNATQAHARALRSHLESLEDILAARAQLVQRAQRVSDDDDIAPRLMREAEAVARWVEVRPEMFDDALEEELGKYERFRAELEEGARRQEDALRGIAERNAVFLDSRREDPSVKARERALQSLDLAYHKYREIHKNLTEGIKVRYVCVLECEAHVCRSFTMTLRPRWGSTRRAARRGCFIAGKMSST